MLLPGEGNEVALSWGRDSYVGFRRVDRVLRCRGLGAGQEGSTHREMPGTPFTSRLFMAPMASGPSSATHFLEPSTRCSTGMPRLVSMILRGLRPLK